MLVENKTGKIFSRTDSGSAVLIQNNLVNSYCFVFDWSGPLAHCSAVFGKRLYLGIQNMLLLKQFGQHISADLFVAKFSRTEKLL